MESPCQSVSLHCDRRLVVCCFDSTAVQTANREIEHDFRLAQNRNRAATPPPPITQMVSVHDVYRVGSQAALRTVRRHGNPGQRAVLLGHAGRPVEGTAGVSGRARLPFSRLGTGSSCRPGDERRRSTLGRWPRGWWRLPLIPFALAMATLRAEMAGWVVKFAIDARIRRSEIKVKQVIMESPCQSVSLHCDRRLVVCCFDSTAVQTANREIEHDFRLAQNRNRAATPPPPIAQQAVAEAVKHGGHQVVRRWLASMTWVLSPCICFSYTVSTIDRGGPAPGRA